MFVLVCVCVRERGPTLLGPIIFLFTFFLGPGSAASSLSLPAMDSMETYSGYIVHKRWSTSTTDTQYGNKTQCPPGLGGATALLLLLLLR